MVTHQLLMLLSCSKAPPAPTLMNHLLFHAHVKVLKQIFRETLLKRIRSLRPIPLIYEEMELHSAF